MRSRNARTPRCRTRTWARGHRWANSIPRRLAPPRRSRERFGTRAGRPETCRSRRRRGPRRGQHEHRAPAYQREKSSVSGDGDKSIPRQCEVRSARPVRSAPRRDHQGPDASAIGPPRECSRPKDPSSARTRRPRQPPAKVGARSPRKNEERHDRKGPIVAMPPWLSIQPVSGRGRRASPCGRYGGHAGHVPERRQTVVDLKHDVITPPKNIPISTSRPDQRIANRPERSRVQEINELGPSPPHIRLQRDVRDPHERGSQKRQAEGGDQQEELTDQVAARDARRRATRAVRRRARRSRREMRRGGLRGPGADCAWRRPPRPQNRHDQEDESRPRHEGPAGFTAFPASGSAGPTGRGRRSTRAGRGRRPRTRGSGRPAGARRCRPTPHARRRNPAGPHFDADGNEALRVEPGLAKQRAPVGQRPASPSTSSTCGGTARNATRCPRASSARRTMPETSTGGVSAVTCGNLVRADRPGQSSGCGLCRYQNHHG